MRRLRRERSTESFTDSQILELSKQMEMLLQEMKDLKDEVRELRSEARIGDGGERIKVMRPLGLDPGAEPAFSLQSAKLQFLRPLKPRQLSTSKLYKPSLTHF